MSVIIRPALAADMSAVCAIHNRQGIATTASYDWEPSDEARWLTWLDGQMAAGLPRLVAEDDGEVLGFASYGPFRSKEGWRHTVEHSIYLAPAAHGHGIGRALMTELILRARADGVHVMVGVVDAGNPASMSFHAALGFDLMGVLREGGRKFDRWLDAAFWTLQLA